MRQEWLTGSSRFLTWNLLTATAPSDSDLTASGVTLRAKVMELKTATTVKAWDGSCRDGDKLCFSGGYSHTLTSIHAQGNWHLIDRHRHTFPENPKWQWQQTSAAVRSWSKAICRVKVHTLDITTTIGATPIVRLWTTPALSSIALSSDRTSGVEIRQRQRADEKAKTDRKREKTK